MSRSFCLERIRIQIEIICESIGDFLGNSAGALRKPLMFLAGIALIMTVRSARRGVRTMKAGGLTAGAHDLPNYRPLSSYGAMGSSNAYPGSLNGMGSAGMPSGPSRATSDLVDMHGTSIRVLEGETFMDFGGLIEFHGQVETLQAYEGAGVVEKVLQSPGDGKVLVVDGAGNRQNAIFGAAAAATAQQNGWKGVIIHGVIRNAQAVGAIPIGVKALGTSPTKGRATSGSKGTVLTVSGMQFSPGMWVYVDKDGIVVSDRELGLDSSASDAGTSMSDATTGEMSNPAIGGIAGGQALPGPNGVYQNGYQNGAYSNGVAGTAAAGMQGTPSYGAASSYGVPPGYARSLPSSDLFGTAAEGLEHRSYDHAGARSYTSWQSAGSRHTQSISARLFIVSSFAWLWYLL